MNPEDSSKSEIERRKRSRNLVLGLVLLFFVILFYAITFVKFGA